MNTEERHKKLSESIDKNRERLRKLRSALSNVRLSTQDRIKYESASKKLNHLITLMVREEVRVFGAAYSKHKYK